jgi:hypothetical protein
MNKSMRIITTIAIKELPLIRPHLSTMKYISNNARRF